MVFYNLFKIENLSVELKNFLWNKLFQIKENINVLFIKEPDISEEVFYTEEEENMRNKKKSKL